MEQRADGIRDEKLTTVKANGACLAAKCDSDELTIIRHCVFDSNRDKIIRGVGHRSCVEGSLPAAGFGSARSVGTPAVAVRFPE